MKRFKIENSTNIDEAGYDYDNRILEIKFKRGGIYQYSPVSPSGWESFMKAESKGKFFEQHIKNNSGITTTKLDELQAS